MLDRYAVMGDPIAHSLSPFIHSKFSEMTGQKLIYEALTVTPDNFIQAVSIFKQQNGKGLNITSPLKSLAFGLVNDMSGRANLAGAVNTIVVRNDGSLFGDNTDGYGLIRDILGNLKWTVRGKRVLVLGAGSVVGIILAELLESRPRSLFIANRTLRKASALAKRFDFYGLPIAVGTLPESQVYDIIINATSASWQQSLPALKDINVSEQTHCYDLAYGVAPTVFLSWARERGAKEVADGKGMLLEQAAKSFYLWRGVHPDIESIQLGNFWQESLLTD